MAGIYWFWGDFVSVRQTKPKKEATKRIISPLSVTSEQVLDASAWRTFNMPRLMAQIKGI